MAATISAKNKGFSARKDPFQVTMIAPPQAFADAEARKNMSAVAGFEYVADAAQADASDKALVRDALKKEFLFQLGIDSKTIGQMQTYYEEAKQETVNPRIRSVFTSFSKKMEENETFEKEIKEKDKSLFAKVVDLVVSLAVDIIGTVVSAPYNLFMGVKGIIQEQKTQQKAMQNYKTHTPELDAAVIDFMENTYLPVEDEFRAIVQQDGDMLVKKYKECMQNGNPEAFSQWISSNYIAGIMRKFNLTVVKVVSEDSHKRMQEAVTRKSAKINDGRDSEKPDKNNAAVISGKNEQSANVDIQDNSLDIEIVDRTLGVPLTAAEIAESEYRNISVDVDALSSSNNVFIDKKTGVYYIKQGETILPVHHHHESHSQDGVKNVAPHINTYVAHDGGIDNVKKLVEDIKEKNNGSSPETTQPGN